MENIKINRKITERADEFAEREHVCGANEIAHLSKGYYWGYKEAQKDLALTPDDIKLIIKIHYELVFKDTSGIKVGDVPSEVLRRFNESRKEK